MVCGEVATMPSVATGSVLFGELDTVDCTTATKASAEIAVTGVDCPLSLLPQPLKATSVKANALKTAQR